MRLNGLGSCVLHVFLYPYTVPVPVYVCAQPGTYVIRYGASRVELGRASSSVSLCGRVRIRCLQRCSVERVHRYSVVFGKGFCMNCHSNEKRRKIKLNRIRLNIFWTPSIFCLVDQPRTGMGWIK